MSFKTGLIIGLAIGYYFGAKAGRERYEQIDRYLEPIRNSDGYQQVRDIAGDLFGGSISATRHAFKDATAPDPANIVDIRNSR